MTFVCLNPGPGDAGLMAPAAVSLYGLPMSERASLTESRACLYFRGAKGLGIFSLRSDAARLGLR